MSHHPLPPPQNMQGGWTNPRRPPRAQQTLPYHLSDGREATLGLSYTPPTPALLGRPPIILLHGLNGDMRIWQSGPPDTWPARQQGAHPFPPSPIPRFHMTDAAWKDPTGLWEALEAAGFAAVSWRQNDRGGGLPGETDHELAAVVAFARQLYQADRVCLVAHSRGGLISRAYLTHPGAADQVALLITMGTPHYGTRIAAVPQQVAGQLSNALLSSFGLAGKLASAVITPALIGALNALTMRLFGATDIDMIAWKPPFNPRLVDIMTRSVHPQVRYVAIAGVVPHATDMRIYYYNIGSYLPVITGFPPQVHFQWDETTAPPPTEPPAPFSQLFGELADQWHIGPIQEMPEVHSPSASQPEGGDGLVPKWSAWFGDDRRLTAADPRAPTVYIRNYAFRTGHSLLTRDPAVHEAVLHELRALAE